MQNKFLNTFVSVALRKMQSNTLSKDKNNQEIGQNHQETGQKSTLNSPGNVKKSIVIDPATRKLDAAIEKAFKFNDFNDMAQALQIGNSQYLRKINTSLTDELID